MFRRGEIDDPCTGSGRTKPIASKTVHSRTIGQPH